MIITKKKLVGGSVAAAIVLVVWLVFNPPCKFGYCCYAYTTYNAMPRPLSDLQIRCDGTVRKIQKTHALTYEMIEWLLDPLPEVLIVATGWDGVTQPDERIQNIKSCAVHILKNKEAIALFNQLKKEKKRVAIHFHSTC